MVLQLMFVAADIKEDNLAKPFLTLFGLEESEDPVVKYLVVLASHVQFLIKIS